jgi:hypothetical protein
MIINGFLELSSVSKDIIFYMFELEFELQTFRLSILIVKILAIKLQISDNQQCAAAHY